MAKNKSLLPEPVKSDGLESQSVIAFDLHEGEGYSMVLADRLRQLGHRIALMPIRDIAPGRLVQDARNSARLGGALILVLSPRAHRAEWARFELEFFARRNRLVLPIMFDSPRGFDTTTRMGFDVRDVRYLLEDGRRLAQGPSDQIVHIIARALDTLDSEASSQAESEPTPETEGTQPLNEGKLILVGRGEVGKTSLVGRLVRNKFSGDERKTQGINITRWSIRCEFGQVRLNIWDFGGQEIMHATHRFFLTERSLYLLVLNGREGGEDEDAEYWLKHIESFGAGSPILVVQNKTIQHPFDLNYRGLQSRYPQIVGFYKTDCENATGIEKLRGGIRAALAEMKEVRMDFPREWLRVKQQLERSNVDFMGYEAFEGLCRERGVSSESDREALSWVLHCLGIALNYRDDARLRETSVLRPEWLTHGIYRLLNAKTVSDRLGELHLSDLAGLLDKARYPAAKHFFLLELMRKFDLCFSFPDEQDRYLIPELLGKEEPPEAADYLKSACLGFQYHYAVLPEGLIPRFLVRSHVLSRGQKRWRTGVILTHEGCQALVMAEPGERRVVIRVKGGDAGSRRRLLAIIRYDFDRIHAEFKETFEVSARVPLLAHPAFSVAYTKLLAFEAKRIKEFPEFVGTDIVAIDVQQLLNGVDLPVPSKGEFEMNPSSLFFSYSHKDESLRDELETHLKLLQRQGVISTWHDRKIVAGQDWDGQIDHHLRTAEIILLLVSSDFLASNYCWEKEIAVAMDRHAAGEATVIPVFLRKCDWSGTPFGKLQGLPRDAKPVKAWDDRDDAWTDVAQGIRSAATVRRKA